jgi:hypothetical protein
LILQHGTVRESSYGGHLYRELGGNLGSLKALRPKRAPAADPNAATKLLVSLSCGRPRQAYLLPEDPAAFAARLNRLVARGFGA